MQKQKGDLNRIIIDLEQNLEAKQALELEIEQLKGKFNVMRHMGGTDDNIEQRLAEKEQELEYLSDYCQALITKERSSTDEQQEARKVLINVSSLYFLFYVFFNSLKIGSYLASWLCFGDVCLLRLVYKIMYFPFKLQLYMI